MFKAYSIVLPRYEEDGYLASNTREAYQHFAKYCTRFGYTGQEIKAAIKEEPVFTFIKNKLAREWSVK